MLTHAREVVIVALTIQKVSGRMRTGPVKLMYALIRELTTMRIFLPKLYGIYGEGVWMLCGFRQGSPEAGIICPCTVSSSEGPSSDCMLPVLDSL